METAKKPFGAGRPKGTDNITYIKDPLLGKYHIVIKDNIFEVSQTSSVAKEKNMGYFTTLGGALGKIAKLQTNEKYKTFSLKEYIDEYKLIVNTLNQQFL